PSRRRRTRAYRDWSSDVCSSDLSPFRIRPRRGRILKGLAAHLESAHGRSVTRAIEEAAIVAIAVAGNSEVHGFLRRGEVARIEARFVGVEQGENAENLIVEGAFERGPADPMSKPSLLTPSFTEHAIDRL